MNFTPTGENCPVVLVILISIIEHCNCSERIRKTLDTVKRHLTMKLEGRISSQFHANEKQYDMN